MARKRKAKEPAEMCSADGDEHTAAPQQVADTKVMIAEAALVRQRAMLTRERAREVRRLVQEHRAQLYREWSQLKLAALPTRTSDVWGDALDAHKRKRAS
jgi:hypothetical protein